MISILIPTYNYNVYKLVQELHQQGQRMEQDFEIRVYDDCSVFTIPENEKINHLSHSTFTSLKKNIGRSAIRGLLAEDAKFDWLLFLDADVMPKRTDFIEKYIKGIKETDADVVFGGISYEEKKPNVKKLLRWEYGRNREAKSVDLRKKEPYFIISQNLCIKKDVFLKANTLIENYYGLDNFFSNQLKNIKAKVLHIDNPVIHLGLEENEKFLRKALKAVETTVILEGRGLMDANMRPIQKSFLKLKKFRLQNIFSFIISKFDRRMENNFNSKNPNLFWFDLYRLNYYIQLKKKHND